MQASDLVPFTAALITTLDEHDAPSGLIYANFMEKGMTFDEYTRWIAALTATGVLVVSNNVLSLTALGRKYAAEINAAVKH